MKKVFQQKYVLRAIAFLVLALITISVSEPKISEYNSQVRERQETLRVEAGGVDDKKISFGMYSSSPPLNDFFTFLFSALFLSLILTKRIIFSFLSLFLFCLQIRFGGSLIESIIKQAGHSPYSEFESIFLEVFIAACLLALSFWLAFYVCRFCKQRFQSNVFIK